MQVSKNMNDFNCDFRMPGEFEPQESVLMMWPLRSTITTDGTYNQDIVAIQLIDNLLKYGECRVIISCYDENLKAHAQKKLLAAQIQTDKIEFIVYPSPIIYPRDFGAEVMLSPRGERLHVDFDSSTYGYNPTSALDRNSKILEGFARVHTAHLGITNSRFTRLVSEGGDREFNGNGIMITIEDTELNKRNPGCSKQQAEYEFKRLFNLKKIIWIPRGTFDDENMYTGPIPDENNEYKAYRSASANGHVDEMCRFVDQDTILLAEITAEEASRSKLAAFNKERLDEAHAVIRAACNADGRPFNIIRIPVPEPFFIKLEPEAPYYKQYMSFSDFNGGRMLDGSSFPTGTLKILPALSYCNFLICNGLVIAQKYYREGMPEVVKAKDKLALEILQKAFPRRKVVQIETTALNFNGGGIHCNTRNVPRVNIPN
jgi:agmatine deiminase